MVKRIELPVIDFWVVCRDDEDYNEEFGPNGYDAALEYLHEKLTERPDLKFELIAEIDTEKINDPQS